MTCPEALLFVVDTFVGRLGFASPWHWQHRVLVVFRRLVYLAVGKGGCDWMLSIRIGRDGNYPGVGDLYMRWNCLRDLFCESLQGYIMHLAIAPRRRTGRTGRFVM